MGDQVAKDEYPDDDEDECTAFGCSECQDDNKDQVNEENDEDLEDEGQVREAIAESGAKVLEIANLVASTDGQAKADRARDIKKISRGCE